MLRIVERASYLCLNLEATAPKRLSIRPTRSVSLAKTSPLYTMSNDESQSLLATGNVGDQVRQQYHGIVVSVSYDNPSRRQTRRFLSSKYGHYAVLLLVSLDVSCIFADFLISLYICDHTCDKGQPVDKSLPEAQDALGIVSLIFSCLFMVELLASIWAFGLGWVDSIQTKRTILTESKILQV